MARCGVRSDFVSCGVTHALHARLRHHCYGMGHVPSERLCVPGDGRLKECRPRNLAFQECPVSRVTAVYLLEACALILAVGMTTAWAVSCCEFSQAWFSPSTAFVYGLHCHFGSTSVDWSVMGALGGMLLSPLRHGAACSTNASKESRSILYVGSKRFYFIACEKK